MKRVKSDKTSDITYPCLMVHSHGDVVLLTSDCEGMKVFAAEDGIELGEYRTDWIMANFTPYTGTVTLSN